VTPRLRVGLASALVSGCSALGAPTPGEPGLVSPSPAPVARVSSPASPVGAPAAPKATEPARIEAASEQVESRTAPVEPPPEIELVATAREAFVHARPNRRSPRLGYARLGARLKRDPAPTSGDGCPGGWYGVAPDGYVCVGPTASLDLTHRVAEIARPRPERDDPLPYAYARSKGFAPPLYARLPSRVDQTSVEGGAKPAKRPAPGWEGIEDAPLPGLLAEGRSLPTVFGFARGAASDPEPVVPNSAFALLSTHEHEGRRFGLTTDLELVPLDRVNRVRANEFRGIALGAGVSLPVVFVRSKSALLYAGGPEMGLRILRPLGFREPVAVTGRSAFFGGRRYLEAQGGDWLADAELVRIDPPKRLPTWANGQKTWIHVSIAAQTLVAYVGRDPAYATLVSTGADYLADATESRATPRGEFLVHTKHVTATMSGDEVGDEFDLRDVPYVQYFSGNYAFHAAYWHDAFGAPKSHGCVNLSPIDARWLFHFTEPPVPRGWHGAFSLREGTLVSITH
jgi:hypothetical protein